jgi:hypothetical protein
MGRQGSLPRALSPQAWRSFFPLLISLGRPMVKTFAQNEHLLRREARAR